MALDGYRQTASERPSRISTDSPGPIEQAEILYQERFASGHSRKNLLTRFGGAHNCLRLVVTKDRLWVTSWMPLFSRCGSVLDLEHVVPLDRISSVRRSWFLMLPSVLVSFRDSGGEEHTLWLFSWHRNRFIASLGGEKLPNLEV